LLTIIEFQVKMSNRDVLLEIFCHELETSISDLITPRIMLK